MYHTNSQKKYFELDKLSRSYIGKKKTFLDLYHEYKTKRILRMDTTMTVKEDELDVFFTTLNKLKKELSEIMQQINVIRKSVGLKEIRFQLPTITSYVNDEKFGIRELDSEVVQASVVTGNTRPNLDDYDEMNHIIPEVDPGEQLQNEIDRVNAQRKLPLFIIRKR